MYVPFDSDEHAVNMLTRQEFYPLRGSTWHNDRTDEASTALLAAERGHVAPTVTSHTPQLFGRRVFSPASAERTMLFVHGTGTGKCHGADTLVMMADYTTKPVQDVTVGDLLAGDDGRPRRVLRLATGTGGLFRIAGRLSSFTCTANHTLCLRDNRGEVHEMTLVDYLRLPKGRQESLGAYKVLPAVFRGRSLASRMAEVAAIGPGFFDVSGGADVDGQSSATDDLVQLARSAGYEAEPVEAAGAVVQLAPFDGRFEVSFIGSAPYYGFEVDGNHRYLLGDFIVTHNSYTGLGVSVTFTEAYRKIYKGVLGRQPEGSIDHQWVNRNTPSVFVLGWEATSQAFMRDLLKYPEFGFITPEELAELRKRVAAADSGQPEHIKFARDYKSMLRQRVQTKAKGGFYQFFGYIEFVNRLFSGKPLVEVEKEVLGRIRGGERVTLEEAVAEYIASGDIKVNAGFVNQFHGSLLIVDEFHNLYNSMIKNNRGVAIYYLLSAVPTLRMIGLTATPANSPREVLEYLSLLKVQRLVKEDFFADRRLLPGALERLAGIGRGHISFLQDTNLKYFPTQTFCGTPIVIDSREDGIPSGQIPYLLFVQCPMSKLHQETYEAFCAAAIEARDESPASDDPSLERDDDPPLERDDPPPERDDGEPTAASPEPSAADTLDDAVNMADTSGRVPIPVDGLTIYDMVFPGGHFRSKETRAAVASMTAAERATYQIDVKKIGTASVFTGGFLRADNIGRYSAKYAKLWDIIWQGIVATRGDPKLAEKTLVYHNAVRMSGVLLIQELLVANGFIYWTESPTANTICFHCGRKQRDHPSRGEGSSLSGGIDSPAPITPHIYVPARLINIHSEVDKITIDAQLTSYASAANLYGELIGVIIGSKKIKEGFEIPHTRRLIITSFPTNISTLLQLKGRVARKGSHLLLDADKRTVMIHILVSTVNLELPHASTVAPEVYRYAEKLQDYKVIQQIERVQNENAVDAPILYDINMNDDVRAQTAQDALGNLFFEPKLTLPAVSHPSTLTFYAYRWAEEELKMVIWCIKRLLLMRPYWTYDELWAAVRAPPFGLEANPAMFQENSFVIALSFLTSGAKDVGLWKSYGASEQLMLTPKDILCDPSRGINRASGSTGNGHLSRVAKIGDMYGLFPIHVDKAAVGHDQWSTTARVSVDAETFLRPLGAANRRPISVQDYLMKGELNQLHVAQRDALLARFTAGQLPPLAFVLEYSRDFQVKMVEEAIVGLLNEAAEGRMGAPSASAADNREGLSTNTQDDGPLAGQRTQRTQRALWETILELANSFSAVITKREVWKYKDVAKQFGQEMAAVDPEAYIAFCTSTSVRIFDVSSGRWSDVNRVALNRQVPYVENSICVGYLEPKGEKIVFKTREPGGNVGIKDKRLLSTGATCETRTKDDIWAMAAKLGVSVSKAEDRSIKAICAAIRDTLIVKEQHERRKKSLIKYLYGWWDVLVVAR